MKQKIELARHPHPLLTDANHPSWMSGIQKSYSKISGLLSAGCAVAAISILAASCSQENAGPHFETSGEAVTAYREHLSAVQSTESMEWDELAASVASWQELRDSVSAALQRDTIRRAHDYPGDTFRSVHRSIAAEYERLALTKPRTYRDVLYQKEQGAPAARREDLRLQAEKLQPFFASLDTIPNIRTHPDRHWPVTTVSFPPRWDVALRTKGNSLSSCGTRMSCSAPTWPVFPNWQARQWP